MAESLTKKDVEEIAALARLALGERELEVLRADLSSILEHMETLRALDTEGVEPMTHAIPTALRLRPDEVAPSLPVEDAVGQAPDRSDDFFRVPGIIRRGEPK